MADFGFIEPHDAHIHMALDGVDWKVALDRHRQIADEQQIRATLEAYAERGCTYLRDGGDRFGAGMLAANLASEYGIEYATPAFPIYEKGNYGAFIGRGFETFDDYKALVDQACYEGATFIKLMLTGIMDFNEFGVLTGYALPGEKMEQLISHAHSKGLSVMGHINGSQAVKDAIDAGIDSVEHGYYMDDATLEVLAASSTIWVPTLAPICNLIGTGEFPDEVLTQIRDSQISAIRKAASMGAKIACGSDGGAGTVTHPQGAFDECALLGKALGDSFGSCIIVSLYELKERFPGLAPQVCSTCGW